MIDKELVTDLAIAYIAKLNALNLDDTPGFIADLALQTYDIINKAGQVDDIVFAAKPYTTVQYALMIDKQFVRLSVVNVFKTHADPFANTVTVIHDHGRQVLQNPQRFVDSLAVTGDANEIHELLRQDSCKSDGFEGVPTYPTQDHYEIVPPGYSDFKIQELNETP